MRSTYEVAGDAAAIAWEKATLEALACGMSPRDAHELGRIYWHDALAEHGWTNDELGDEASRRIAAKDALTAEGVCRCGLESCICPKK